MKYADINKRFTEIVAEYMGKGYTINASTMSGSQGETARIDLTNGTEIIRVIVCNFYECTDYYHVDGDEIVVGKVTDDVKPNDNSYNRRTVWNQHLIDKENDYYVTKEEATEAAKIRAERWTRSDSKYEILTSPKAVDLAVKIVREKLGYRRVNRADVKIQKNHKTNQYTVAYNCKFYTLH